MDIPKQNTGVLIGKRAEDWIGGTILYEPRNPAGDWRGFLPKEEKQYSDNVDTMGCVSFSANNSLEIQHKQQIGSEINFSDRFLAKASDTQKFGNWQYKVADTLRLTGIVLEDEYPAPANYTWDTYYAPIPVEVLAKARKFDIAYEWIEPTKTELLYHLRHAPLQIVITKDNPNHAVVLVALEGDTAYYFDTYPPYLKTINVSQIYNALKIVGNFMNDHVKIANIKGTVGIFIGAEDIPQLISLGKAFGRPVQVDANNNVTNADIVV